jgi:predicted alternative tryptophan synthase beta-subunit
MFEFINRDYIFGVVTGGALFSLIAFAAGCESDEEKDTGDTATEECASETVTTPTGTTGETSPTETGDTSTEEEE